MFVSVHSCHTDSIDRSFVCSCALIHSLAHIHAFIFLTFYPMHHTDGDDDSDGGSRSSNSTSHNAHRNDNSFMDSDCVCVFRWDFLPLFFRNPLQEEKLNYRCALCCWSWISLMFPLATRFSSVVRHSRAKHFSIGCWEHGHFVLSGERHTDKIKLETAAAAAAPTTA